MSLDTRPYRDNVGAVLFDRRGLVFVARRSGPPDRGGGGWQFPQGGIDPHEDPEGAVLRELSEEIGTAKALVLGRHPEWLTYDFPDHVQWHSRGGRYRGQRQLWFALRFIGTDADIRLDADPHPEFDDWRWMPLSEVPALAVDFKRPVYEAIARSFAGFAIAPD